MYLFSSTFTLDEVLEKMPPKDHFGEIMGYPWWIHLILVLILLTCALFLYLKKKYNSTPLELFYIFSLIFSIFAVAIYLLIIPLLTGADNTFHKKHREWYENYVLPYYESIPTQTTSAIHKIDYKKTITNTYMADVVFSAGNEIVNKRVPIIPKGNEYLVEYKYLEDDLAIYNQGYFDIKLIVPKDFKIE